MPKRFQMWLCVLGLAGLLLAGCNQHSASSPRLAEAAIPAGQIGSHLPAFTVKDLQGREIPSNDLRGRVVLIDFWATWCDPCKKGMPGYQQLLDRYGSNGFAVIGFKFDIMADTEDPLQFAKRIGIRYPLAVASAEVKNRFGGILGLPTTFLYDRQGILRKKIIGFEYTANIESAIKPLL
jgi:thiol-disulfide isomerase/thioredoxin